MKDLIQSKKLGKIYKCRIFYGNGTSMLVKKSKWRDKGKGVLIDIGSHLLDLCLYWFNGKIESIKVVELNKFENVNKTFFATYGNKIFFYFLIFYISLFFFINRRGHK